MKKNEFKKLGLSIKEFNNFCKLFAKYLEQPKEEKDEKLINISCQLPYTYDYIKSIYEILEDYDLIIPWCNWCNKRNFLPYGHLRDILELLDNKIDVKHIVKKLTNDKKRKNKSDNS